MCCELVRRCFVSLSAGWDGKKSITKNVLCHPSGVSLWKHNALWVCSFGGGPGMLWWRYFDQSHLKEQRHISKLHYRFSCLVLCWWFLKVARFLCIPQSPKSGRLLVNQLHWYEIVGRCWHAFAFSTNGCLHHVCVSVLLREEPLYWSLHSGDHCGVLQKYLSACVGVSLCMEDPKQQDPHPFVLLFVYFLVSCLSSCTS